MKVHIFLFVFLSSVVCSAQEATQATFERVYETWRSSLLSKNEAKWQRVTADHRRLEIRNRIVSEKRAFPAAVFELPIAPPALRGLKFLEVKQKGATAKVAYFGKVDFGVGGEPTDNLLLLSFVNSPRGWLYDKADFVNLNALEEVRSELLAGNYSYLSGVPEAQPTGIIPPLPIAVKPAEIIAKVYVFCPNREVNLQINKVSRHRFANDKQAEIVIGGARQGLNEIQYSIRNLEGGKDDQALAIRVYLLSEVPGMKPIKAFEYLLTEKDKSKAFGTGTFSVSAAMASKLTGN